MTNFQQHSSDWVKLYGSQPETTYSRNQSYVEDNHKFILSLTYAKLLLIAQNLNGKKPSTYRIKAFKIMIKKLIPERNLYGFQILSH